MRVRGLPLDAGDLTVRCLFENFGEVVSGPHHVMWRGTTIKTGDRTLKVKLVRDIPQSFSTLGGKTKVTVRYRDQPKTCFSCGATGHERRDCPTHDESTYAQAVANPPTDAVANPPTDAVANPPTDAVANPPTDAVANPPTVAVANPPTGAVAVAQTDAVENTPTVAVDTLSEDNPQTSSDSEGAMEQKKERRERRRKEKELRKMDTSFGPSENKRKDVSSPETPPRTSRAKHSGLPQRAPTHKQQKM